MTYHSPERRQEIICAIISGKTSEELSDYDLAPDEQSFFRSHAVAAVDAAVRRTSKFSSYYKMPIKDPFIFVAGLIAVIMLLCVPSILELLSRADLKDKQTYPLFAAAATTAAIGVASAGWAVAGWIAHRNARIAQTMSVLMTRFSQPAFTNHLANFWRAFDESPSHLVTTSDVKRLALSNNDVDHDAVQSLRYLLNYLEFMAYGISRGDLDYEIIKENQRGNIILIFDKCLPYIRDLQQQNPRALRHIRRLRDDFRQP